MKLTGFQEIISELSPEAISAIGKALVSRGKNKGKLKKQCPPMDTPEAAAWQALIFHSNPYKLGFGHLLFMSEENRKIYNEIEIAFSEGFADNLDRDAEALKSLGVW